MADVDPLALPPGWETRYGPGRERSSGFINKELVRPVEMGMMSLPEEDCKPLLLAELPGINIDVSSSQRVALALSPSSDTTRNQYMKNCVNRNFPEICDNFSFSPGRDVKIEFPENSCTIKSELPEMRHYVKGRLSLLRHFKTESQRSAEDQFQDIIFFTHHSSTEEIILDGCDEKHSKSVTNGEMVEQLKFSSSNHTKKRHLQNNVICETYDDDFSTLYNFERNTRISNKKLSKCDKLFRRKDHLNLIRRTEIRIDKKMFKCEICNKLFSRNCYLVKHNCVHLEEKPYKCDICNAAFRQISNLVQHSRKHTGEKPFKCDICDELFRQKSNLIQHGRKHTGERPYQCVVCSKSYPQLANLIQHSAQHPGEKKYKCDVCSMSFSFKYQLIHHNSEHTGEKKYKCDVCRMSFSFKYQLIHHNSEHTGEKKYKCDVCSMSFSFKYQLIHHNSEHTGEKKYKCDVCSMSFSFKYQLIRHNSKHTGEKSFNNIGTCVKGVLTKISSHSAHQTIGKRPYKRKLKLH